MRTNPNRASDSIQPTIKYYGDILTINNNIVPYLKQVAYSEDRLMISDLGYEIAFNSQLKAYDHELFESLFRQQLFYELESSHISIGLKILRNMPELLADHYQHVFSRLSIDKINDMLQDNAFYSFIAGSICAIFFRLNRDQNSDIATLEQSQAYIQALNLLFLLEGSGTKLQSIFHQIASKLVYRKFEELKNCYSESGSTISEGTTTDLQPKNVSVLSILKHMMKISLSSTYLKQIQIQIQDKLQDQRITEQMVYDQKFLSFLKNHFKEYFQQGRQDLLVTLCILSNDCKYSLWENVVCQAQPNEELFYTFQSKQQARNRLRQNQIIFKEMIFEYYLGVDDNWGNCIFLLQNLIKKDHNDSLDGFITDILAEMHYRSTRIELVDLACFHIRRIVTNKKVENADFKQFLSSFLLKICSKIDEQYFKFCRLNKKKPKSLYSKLLSSCKFIVFPKINSVWISAILRAFTLIIQLKLIDLLNCFNFQANIQRLVQMSKNGKGLTFGSLKAFAKAVDKQSSINSQRQENGYLLPIEGSRIYGIRQILVNEMIL